MMPGRASVARGHASGLTGSAMPALRVAPPGPSVEEDGPRGTAHGDGAAPFDESLFSELLRHYRDLVISEIRSVIATKRFRRTLSRRLAEYPLRAGKGLRPALCLATCRAYGGQLAEALPSAVALELFHNAFLVHDDIEDESIHRRGSPTIHQKYGVAIAVNVGDALNALTMTPLLHNLEAIGLEKSLRVFREIEQMGRESVDGQAMELEWVKTRYWDLTDRHYHTMTTKKTCWYTCITPCRIGALIGGGPEVDLQPFIAFGRYLGIAFQIQDDLLNLVGEEEKYGKETAGDIREGKRTLMLIKLLEWTSGEERQRIIQILSKEREEKSEEDVEYILDLMHRHGCLAYAREVSSGFARKAKALFQRHMGRLPDSPDKRFLEYTIDYVIHRDL
jgi:geranylgeranyl diphosphate synthase, type II